MNTKKYMLLIVIALTVSGCSGKHEGLLLGSMTKTMLPEIKKESKEAKMFLLSGQKCLHKAKTVEEANACNDQLRAKDPELEVDDFTQWTSKEKAEVDKFVNEHVAFYDCIIAAPTVSVAAECKEP
jgi:hypothetical protein